ncbi:MAG: UvrB/UvrC motif-containing protein, partial [Pyrinomonadaceae bacterium]|nr:UvrB/UvrC motif-containing protein [Pyrinomonadaceae bacterium]
ARILIDFVNRVFRLRSCELPVDGSFNYPCTMYYKRRCLAPCVSDLCTEKDYAEIVEPVRVFLADEREQFLLMLAAKMDAASEKLDFESAARWRDIQNAAEEYWSNSRTLPWLGGASDTIRTLVSDNGLDLFLVTQKGRRVLGERTYTFPNATSADISDAIADVIEQFYLFHAPREIRVSHPPARRKELQAILRERHGLSVPIVLLNENNQKLLTELAVFRSATDLEVKRSAPVVSAAKISRELRERFSLTVLLRRITAIDVSHIFGTDQTAASVTWENGSMTPDSGEYMLVENAGETAALAALVARRYADRKLKELVLIDGGRSQLNAAVRALPPDSNVELISAVKPPGKHSEVSHFLTADGRRIDFDPSSPAMMLLQKLRDEAHDLANAIHREVREFSNVYEWATILPSITESERQRLLAAFSTRAKLLGAEPQRLIELLGPERASVALNDIAAYRQNARPQVRPLVVPVTLQDRNGAADDLRPIENLRKPRR